MRKIVFGTLIFVMITTSGCALKLGKSLWGPGKYEVEYYDDGKTIKKEKIEAKTPFSDIFGIKIGTPE